MLAALLGPVHVLLPLALRSAARRDALENVTEWWAGAILPVYLFVLACAWWTTGFVAAVHARPR